MSKTVLGCDSKCDSNSLTFPFKLNNIRDPISCCWERWISFFEKQQCVWVLTQNLLSARAHFGFCRSIYFSSNLAVIISIRTVKKFLKSIRSQNISGLFLYLQRYFFQNWQFFQKNSWPWTHRFLGEWSTNWATTPPKLRRAI